MPASVPPPLRRLSGILRDLVDRGRSAFDDCDARGRGRLDAREFAAFVRVVAPDASARETREILAAMAEDPVTSPAGPGGGEVTFQEMLRLFAATEPPPPPGGGAVGGGGGSSLRASGSGAHGVYGAHGAHGAHGGGYSSSLRASGGATPMMGSPRGEHPETPVARRTTGGGASTAVAAARPGPAARRPTAARPTARGPGPAAEETWTLHEEKIGGVTYLVDREVRSIHWYPYDHVRVVNADPE